MLWCKGEGLLEEKELGGWGQGCRSPVGVKCFIIIFIIFIYLLYILFIILFFLL